MQQSVGLPTTPEDHVTLPYLTFHLSGVRVLWPLALCCNDLPHRAGEVAQQRRSS